MQAEGKGPRTAAVEMGTALVLAMIGAAAIWDSWRLGTGWGVEGPKSGTFPFWIGLILIAASLGNAWQAARAADGGNFASWGQLRLVLSVLLPTTIYVAAIPFTGIYVASALLVAWFMARLGGFRWPVALASGIAVALVTFVVFETWFLVALPKGPLEEWLGY